MAYITIKGDDGEFAAYLASPKPKAGDGQAPGMVVIQEIFGVNAYMRSVCDRLAERGYLALCSDLFWRQERGVDITDKTEAEWQKAFELYKGFNEAKGALDLVATLAHLRGLPSCSGKAGSVGFCLGGKLAYLMATRSNADCNISYYGVGIENALNEAAAITKPLLMHIAEEDKFVPKEAQAAIRKSLGTNCAVTIHSYPGVDHAFARPGGENWNAAAAELANERTDAFLRRHLAP